MAVLTRLEIAELQLERALQLYLEERDHVAAITLASAAEAILERLRGTSGAAEAERTALFVRRWRSYFRRQALIRMAEAMRTGLHHFPDRGAAFEPDDVARDVLQRAIAKHASLTGNLSPRMRRFQALVLEEAARPVASESGP